MQKGKETSAARRTGVLIHPTSFPSPFGIGDLGREAREMLLSLSSAGVSLWQILPLGPTGYGDSPYSSKSCFAGNELLIDLRTIDRLCPDGNLGLNWKDLDPEDDEQSLFGRVDYNHVYEHKMVYLKQFALAFASKYPDDENYNAFCRDNSWWLDDYCLYQALARHFNDSRWFVWPEDIKKRTSGAIATWSKTLKSDILTYKVLQYFFFRQWSSLHSYANELGISIIGDIPIYAAADSADVWTHPELFKLDSDLSQTALAGCPPDSYSAVGQLWGNPVYDWPVHEKDHFKWWRKRMEMTLELVDIVRIDHFRGFESYWEVPAGEETAVNGHWVEGPGMKLLKHFKGMGVIAEDLGSITPAVIKLRLDAKLPSMKVMQFGFPLDGSEFVSSNMYLPHNYTPDSVSYTSTHDNQTARGWFNSLCPETRDVARQYFQCSDDDIVWQMIRSGVASSSQYFILSMQDLLGLDDSARMNVPSTVGSCNWSWRYDSRLLQSWMLDRLGLFNRMYGRC